MDKYVHRNNNFISLWKGILKTMWHNVFRVRSIITLLQLHLSWKLSKQCHQKKISAKHLSVNKPQRISPTKGFTLLSLSRLWYQGTLKIYQEMKTEKVQTKATFHLLFEWRFKIFRKYAFMFCFMETVHDTGRPIIYSSLAFFWVKDWVLVNTNNILSLTTKPTPRKNRTSAELLTSSSISATRFKY